MRPQLRSVLRTSIFAAVATLLADPGSADPAPAPPSARPVHWGYEGDEGPAHWATLSPVYSTCGAGKAQSPVDLPGGSAGAAQGVKIAYKAAALRVAHHEHVDDIIDNGHTLQVTVDEGSTLTTPRDTYRLAQFHFHSPSEHTLEGRRFPLEVHFVHQGATGKLAVVSALFEEGPEHPALAVLLANLPAGKGDVVHRPDVMIDPAAHLPASPPSLAYDGSLTTPPCSEGVEWFVHREPMKAGRGQLEAFAARLGHNNRPVQPLHDREVRSVAVPRAVEP